MVLDPSKRAHNLDQIALDFLDHKTTRFEELVGGRKGAATFAEVALEDAVPYACEDADVTLLAYERLARRLEEVGLLPLLARGVKKFSDRRTSGAQFEKEEAK